MGRLDGRVAIVTGSGRGIGAGVAKTMAAQGAHVVVNDLGVNVDGSGEDVSPAAQVVAEIREAGGKAVANHDDVGDHAAAENLIRTALNEFGRLDVLVNVAGILRDRMVFNMTEEEWDAVIRVHLKGTFNTSKFASIYWRTTREGDYRLINFTSESGIYGAPGQPNYAAAKAGIVGFTLSCANALGRYGVTANCISPRAATRMTGTIPQREGRNVPDPADEERAPENVAPAVVYLASKESGWLSGRVILAHGYHIGLFNEPKVEAEVVSAGPWDVDTACRLMEETFKTHIGGDAGINAALGRSQ
jgi:NAD(P)-dependent dehydrogenase (short-subunit alcohol dehydrogenase family)